MSGIDPTWMQYGSKSLGRSITQPTAKESNEKPPKTTKASESSAQVPIAIRELNKRIKEVTQDNGEEYGADVTGDELKSRYKTAVALAGKNIKSAWEKLRLAKNVDLCILLDVTGSMQPHIDGVKNYVYQIVDQLKRSRDNQNAQKLRLGLVAYRDFGDTKQFEVLHFTESVEEFRRFCGNLIADGGGDAAEDVFGGLEKAIQLNWDHGNSGTKQIFHIADAPCHGKQFQLGGTHDYYPGGDPNGRTHTGLFAQILQSNIQYSFGSINNSTDIMLKKFGNAYGNLIVPFDIKNVANICESVVTAVRESMLTAGTTIAAGSSKTPMKHFEYDMEEPDWSRLRGLEGHSMTYKFPNSIKGIVANEPLERAKTKFAHIKIAPKPFAKGAERAAFYGQDIRSDPPLAIVLKEHLRNYGSSVATRFEESNQMQTIAAYLAERFCSEVKAKIGETVPMKFLKSKTVAIGKGPSARFLAYERRFPSSDQFVRFTNNNTYKIPEEKRKAMGVPAKFVDFVMAFSHWTYHKTGGKIMVADLQGILSRSAGSEPTLLLTDPAIHCTDKTRFRPMNFGSKGMNDYFSNHECNRYCKALGM